MSQAAMARELNRSTGLVSKLVKQMGLTEAKASAQPEEIPEPEPDDGSALSRLKRLQGIVWRNILGCDPRNLAQLSKEYRALTQEIENLERAGGGGDYGESAAVDTLLEAIGRKLSS